MPHTVPNNYSVNGQTPGKRHREKKLLMTQPSHLLFNKWMRVETQGQDNSKVSINKKWGQRGACACTAPHK